MQSDLPGLILQRGNSLDEPMLKRSKLVLPAPQVSDLELENLIKVCFNWLCNYQLITSAHCGNETITLDL